MKLYLILQPLPPLPDDAHPYEVPYGSERVSGTSSHSIGGYTMQTRQVMTVSGNYTMSYQ